MVTIVCTTADSAQIDLLSIYIVSSDKDNNMFTLSSFDTDDTSKEHIFNNSDNVSEDISSHLCKGKSALKIKIKGKGCVIFTLVTKKQTTAAAKLKFKIASKLKAKFKIKSVK